MTNYKYVKFSYLLAFVAVFLLNSCSTTNNEALFKSQNGVNPEMVKDIYVVNDQGPGELYYRIKEGDVISIRNLQDIYWGGSLSQPTSSVSQNSVATTNTVDQAAVSYIVDKYGQVRLPALKEKVKISGLTRTEARQKIEDLYITGNGKGGLLPDPIIELNIVNLKVHLLGEFASPGEYPLTKDNTTLIEILSQAGGLSKTADPRTVRILRGKETIYVNLTNDRIIGNSKLIMQNGDVVTVDLNKNALDGEKIQRFNNVIQPILVVVNLVILVFTLSK
ncbi:polysaccharide biosynthesis/export family protein [Pedobacter sp. Du54]|uniref:polysaccharide biosynthesis/export family protein n=1 Tax=Pedobacter anseongensis TaxID=3133439 RepID=UPI0030B4204E